jgi:hypothetical protein
MILSDSAHFHHYFNQKEVLLRKRPSQTAIWISVTIAKNSKKAYINEKNTMLIFAGHAIKSVVTMTHPFVRNAQSVKE